MPFFLPRNMNLSRIFVHKKVECTLNVDWNFTGIVGTLFLFMGFKGKSTKYIYEQYVCMFLWNNVKNCHYNINRNTITTVHRTVVLILNEHTVYNHLELHVATVTFTVLLLSQRRRWRGFASVCLAVQHAANGFLHFTLIRVCTVCRNCTCT